MLGLRGERRGALGEYEKRSIPQAKKGKKTTQLSVGRGRGQLLFLKCRQSRGSGPHAPDHGSKARRACRA
jgi:hypothetical protein